MSDRNFITINCPKAEQAVNLVQALIDCECTVHVDVMKKPSVLHVGEMLFDGYAIKVFDQINVKNSQEKKEG